SLIPLFIFALITYLQIEQHIKKESLAKLDVLASIQKNRVQNMLDQNAERLTMFTNRMQLKVELDNYNKQNSSYSQQFINRLLDSAKSEINSFKDISILDVSGKVVGSTDKTEIGSNKSNQEFFQKGLKHNDVSVIFKDPRNPNALREYLAGPLILNGKTIGVAAIESDATNNFFTASQNYDGLGQTGEFYVAKRDKNGDALLISSLRFVSDAPLNFKVSKNDVHTPIIQATILKKEKILTDTLDYRGEPVLAATRYIDSADWGIVLKKDQKEAFASLDNLRYLIIFAVTIISVLVVVSSIVVGKSVSKPIIKLRNAAREISNGSLLDAKSKETGDYIVSGNYNNKEKNRHVDEIKDLAFQFDKMRQNIEYANTNLQEIVKQKKKDLEKAIGDLSQKEKHLKASNEKLHHLDKLKNEFINIAAHELRTPTQAILAFADLLEFYPDKQEVIVRIQRNARRLNRLISDILDVTKIESQRLTLRKEVLNIADLIFYVAEEYKEQLKKLPITKDVEFVYLFPKEKGDFLVCADKERMTQVISNLLDNAVKFIEKTGSIYMTIRKGSSSEKDNKGNGVDEVIIDIKDTGIGIHDEIFPRLFTKFATKSTTGTGLGLYISKSIIEAHGGKISAVNNKDEKGATFTISLPLSKKGNPNNLV
ncbi:MAG TPA: ATP-binding protein, partial [Candidatus Nitrosocosmicus sp.]|nr:ATP-binding protein [Candidatus Nitrosocosmicus sp.]